jgi:hypothetical protein
VAAAKSTPASLITDQERNEVLIVFMVFSFLDCSTLGKIIAGNRRDATPLFLPVFCPASAVRHQGGGWFESI